MTTRFSDAPGVFASPFYSQIAETVGAARIVHISGQVGVAPDGTPADGFEAQTRLAFDSLAAQLAAVGLALTDVVKLTTIITDQANVATFREVRNAVLGGHRPTSTLLVAGLADPRWLVEIEAVAAASQ